MDKMERPGIYYFVFVGTVIFTLLGQIPLCVSLIWLLFLLLFKTRDNQKEQLGSVHICLTLMSSEMQLTVSGSLSFFSSTCVNWSCVSS